MKKPKHISEDKIITEEEYQKLKTTLRFQINGILQVFNGYGLGEQIIPVTDMIVELAENYGQALRGDKHKPIHVIAKPLMRPTE